MLWARFCVTYFTYIQPVWGSPLCVSSNSRKVTGNRGAKKFIFQLRIYVISVCWFQLNKLEGNDQVNGDGIYQYRLRCKRR